MNKAYCYHIFSLVFLLVNIQLHAQTENSSIETEQLDSIVITASNLEQAPENIAQPTTVITGNELAKNQANTIGETVNKTPGIHSSYFGPGVGRPIIRGLDGSRVLILENGLSALDVSAISADHAVSIEPLLAEQIEILKGPTTLLYGSNAIGGIVNVVTNRIPKEIPGSAFTGAAEVRGQSVNDEKTGLFKLEGNHNNWVWHLDGLYRETDDYDIPGFAELKDMEHHEEHDDHEHEDEHESEEERNYGTLPNSFVETQSASIGTAYIGNKGHLGISINQFNNKYGVPGAHHHHENEEIHDEHESKDEEIPITLNLEQTKVTLEGEWWEFNSVINKLFGSITFNDYQHLELENDEIGTRFDNEAIEGRLQLNHDELLGWQGIIGLQYVHKDFLAVGEEAFLPGNETENIGIFWLEEQQFGQLEVEAGLRFENQNITSANTNDIDHHLFSASLGGIYTINDHSKLAIRLSRSERAPGAEELLANGPHVGTQTFEIGNLNLSKETSLNLDLELRIQANYFSGQINVFYNQFDDFIYLAETGEIEDELPVRIWQQQDADFWGIEAETVIDLFANQYGELELELFGDLVNAELNSNENLPRISPARLGLGLNWSKQQWFTNIESIYTAKQKDIAEFETSTASYTLLNAYINYKYQLSSTEWLLFAKATNITDEEARVHTSFLKNVAPLPGRSIHLGARLFF